MDSRPEPGSQCPDCTYVCRENGEPWEQLCPDCTDAVRRAAYRPKLHDRVEVIDGPFAGTRGSVCRMLFRQTHESWVALDERHPTAPHPWPERDPRSTHVLIEWFDLRPEVLRG